MVCTKAAGGLFEGRTRVGSWPFEGYKEMRGLHLQCMSVMRAESQCSRRLRRVVWKLCNKSARVTRGVYEGCEMPAKGLQEGRQE